MPIVESSGEFWPTATKRYKSGGQHHDRKTDASDRCVWIGASAPPGRRFAHARLHQNRSPETETGDRGDGPAASACRVGAGALEMERTPLCLGERTLDQSQERVCVCSGPLEAHASRMVLGARALEKSIA